MGSLMKSPRRIALAGALLAGATLVLAAKDAPKSKDHPLLSRYPNSHIADYAKDYNAVEFAVGRAAMKH